MKKFPGFRVIVLAVTLAFIPGAATAQGGTREDIVELLELTGSDKLMEQMVATMLPQIINVVRVSFPDVPESLLLQFEQRALTVFHESQPELVDILVGVYDRHLTEQEVGDLIAFYRTPTGKRIITVMPVILQESMALGNQWGRMVGERIARDVLTDMSEGKK